VQKPAVKYRGIFLNDEDPALSGWAKAKFGGMNHDFYEQVFELILRLKGNFLWPAMWGKSIYDDDPLSAPLADEIRRGAGHLAPRADGPRPRRVGALRPGAVGLHQEPRESCATSGARASSAWAPTRAWSRSACAATATSR
jgi:hypothetical protein